MFLLSVYLHNTNFTHLPSSCFKAHLFFLAKLEAFKGFFICSTHPNLPSQMAAPCEPGSAPVSGSFSSPLFFRMGSVDGIITVL